MRGGPEWPDVIVVSPQGGAECRSMWECNWNEKVVVGAVRAFNNRKVTGVVGGGGGGGRGTEIGSGTNMKGH